MPHWTMPLDPDCPAVAAAHEAQADDPIWAMADIGEEWWHDFGKRHRPGCERCQEYGAANVEVGP